MYLHKQFIQFPLELILHSLSFPMNLHYKRQEKVCETVTSWHTGHPEVISCQHQTQLLEARGYCSSWTHKVSLIRLAQDQTQSLPKLTAGPFLSGYHPFTTLSVEGISLAYLRQENVPNSAPAAMPTAKPIMKPIFILSKQLGCDCPYGPTVTGI